MTKPSSLLFLLGCLLGAGCSSASTHGESEVPDSGAVRPPVHDSGTSSHDTGSTPHPPSDAESKGPSCSLTTKSGLTNATIVYVSGSSSTDCPSSANMNLASGSCSLSDVEACSGTMTCGLTTQNEDGTMESFSGMGTFTASGSTASAASITLVDLTGGGLTCVVSVSGDLATITGTPGSCSVTCENGEPNNEMGCDPCLMTACPNEYAACMGDTESGGCINCSQLLAGNAGSGICGFRKIWPL